MSDFRQQQELQEELEYQLQEALERVAKGQSTFDDAKLLAWASGITFKGEEHGYNR